MATRHPDGRPHPPPRTLQQHPPLRPPEVPTGAAWGPGLGTGSPRPGRPESLFQPGPPPAAADSSRGIIFGLLAGWGAGARSGGRLGEARNRRASCLRPAAPAQGETPRPEGGGRAPGETEGLSLGPSCFFQEPGGIPQPAQDSEAGGTADREPARRGAGVTRSRQGGCSDRNRGPGQCEVAGRGGNAGSWERETRAGGGRPGILGAEGTRTPEEVP